MTLRIRQCVENWPDCVEGEYDPRCCRFPKSCSCTVYPPDTDLTLLEDPHPAPVRVRPTWDEWGLGIAFAVARRADCTRRQVGAVLIRDDHTVVSTGYNGAPSGAPGCLTDGACPRGHSDVPTRSSYDTGAGSCIAVHAEANALLRASWDEMVGSTLYVTCKPCDGCQRIIDGSPVARVVYPPDSN